MSSLSAFAADKSIPETNCGSQKIRSSDDEDQEVEIQTHAPAKTCVNKEESALVANVTTDKVVLGPGLSVSKKCSTKDKDKKSRIVCGKPDGSNADERIHGYPQLQRPERKERASKA